MSHRLIHVYFSFLYHERFPLPRRRDLEVSYLTE